MKRAVKFVLILISIIFICLSVVIFVAYKNLVPYKKMKIDERIIDAQMECGRSVLYGYDFYDRASRRGKEYILENFNIESSENFSFVELDRIPQHLIDAFVSIEDKRFYKHNGVDFFRTGKACFNYIFKKSSSFGGSTITQQLVKNITGDSEKSIKRKIREIFLAINIEREYTKEEIMCMYLNIINLGNRCRGVAAASELYYSKEIDKLTLSECATIAAITNNPTYYNPISNPQNTRARRDLILDCMLAEGYIDETEHSIAQAEELNLKISGNASEKINSWYTDMVIEDVIDALVKEYQIDRRAASNMVYHGKLRIYTAMDEKIQNLIEKYYADLPSSNTAFPQSSGIKSSFILMDSKTGDILGVVGDVGKKSGNRVQNYAINTKRPSGSVIKPISVYSLALDMGIIKWSSLYDDSPLEEVNGRPWPQNANGKYVGKVGIEYALANSLNTVSVRVLREVGADKSLAFLKNKLHMYSLFDSTDKDIGDMCESSLALGQHKNGVSLKELVAAYTIFDGGVYKKPRSYYKVTDSMGNILLENSEESNRAISNESAAIMTKLLQSVIKEGTAKNRVSLANTVEVAGKTGTTSDNCDRYFIGLTPNIVAGAWMGYEYPKRIEATGNPTIGIWNDIVSRIYSLEGYKDAHMRFEVPDSIARLSYDKSSGEMPDFYSLEEDIRLGWFVK